jgi:hypothetical protein
VAAGAKYRDQVHEKVRPFLHPRPEDAPAATTPKDRFAAEAGRIVELQRRQTKDSILALKSKYEYPVLGKFRVWELIEKLSLCVDPTDTSLGCTNQYLHVCQVIGGLEQAGELDETMLLAALLHDVGKVAMLAGEPPEYVVCYTEPVEGLEPGGGLDDALFQFGHDEIAYSRFKDHVPEHVAWMLRYHSMVLGKAEPYMSARDLDFERTYLTTFREHDQGSKSLWTLPGAGSLARYRDFVEERFPHPILF